jgi:hypothetical protein
LAARKRAHDLVRIVDASGVRAVPKLEVYELLADVEK